jgi:hypothetical protein
MTELSQAVTPLGRNRLRTAVMVSVFSSLTMALYAASGVEPSDSILFYVQLVPTMAVVLWVVQDARQRQIIAVHDLGFFMFIFWPVVVPWYCFKSRGARGWLLLVRLLALILSPWLTGLGVAWIRYLACCTA